MSNFAGVTFAEQKVTPTDDAIFHKFVLEDCILKGCALSYSGTTLTMAAGHLMICGRQMRHAASENWTISDAVSGYARLVLTIDLSLSASAALFNQVQTEIQYATSVTGFAPLAQSDINGAGTKYQTAVCVVSLGAGGITGIVSKLPNVFVVPVNKGGTGAATAAVARNNLGAAPVSHTHEPTDLSGAVPLNKGGTGATKGSEGLKNLFAAGYFVASEHQIKASVGAIPDGAPENAIFFVPIEA